MGVRSHHFLLPLAVWASTSMALADLSPQDARRLTDATVTGEVLEVRESSTSTHRRFVITVSVTSVRGRRRGHLRRMNRAIMQHLCHSGSVAEARGFTRCADTVGRLPAVGSLQTLNLHWTSAASEWGGWSEVTGGESLWTYGVEFERH